MKHNNSPTREFTENSDDVTRAPLTFTLIPSSVTTTTSYIKEEKKTTTTSSRIVTTSKPPVLYSNLKEEHTSQILIEDKCTTLLDGNLDIKPEGDFCSCSLLSPEELKKRTCAYCIVMHLFMGYMCDLYQLDDNSDELSVEFKFGINKRKRKTPEPKVEISTCSICFEDYAPGEYVQNVDCLCNRGYFHRKCIDKWLRKKQTCPLCRDSISKNTKKIKIN